MRQPDFRNLLKVLEKKVPDRPTLFELFLNRPLYEDFAKRSAPEYNTVEEVIFLADAFAAAGYDYATVAASDFQFKVHRESKQTTSLNHSAGLTSRAAFNEYPWPDPEAADYSKMEKAAAHLPKGLKLMPLGPGGILENVTALVGYEDMCMMLHDDPELLQDIFNAVGERLVRYYELCVGYDTVGAVMSNDDWGFNTQTFLSVEDMRKYVYPWHKKIVETAHKAGKPVILHSCGYFGDVMDDVIDVLKYDAKHSYEDVILPVEEAYEQWGGRIAIMGGIDVDFMIRSTPEEIQKRCKAMLERTATQGGYALGTGNSVPEYIPKENYLAMASVAKGAE
ncbi:MAG: hypothetical protein FWD03_02095 [Defluviitaleaceae bacterium]|nr:hypothetical protein [Defluviitaleaceae bacterium]